MSEAVAQEAVECALGRPVDEVRQISSGRSSDAWLVRVSTEHWIARVAIKNSGRRITYLAESLIGCYLESLGHGVAVWTIVEVNGVSCSVARQLPGVPVAYDRNWSEEFGRALAGVLRDLHTMPATGFGPLANDETEACGVSADRNDAIVDRWFHAPVWPFDGSSLADHPILDLAPKLGGLVAGLALQIEAAASGPTGVVHSDLHREHLLVNDDGSLAGVLDFGDAFVGATAWDFALLNWYYGKPNAELVAAHYPSGNEELDRGVVLSVAVGLYKAAKNPADQAVLPRLQRCLEAAQDT